MTATLAPVPPGHIATIVTSLQMVKAPAPRPMPQSRLRLVRWHKPANDKYRQLFRRIGENWLWVSRLTISDDALSRILQDPGVKIWAVVDPRNIEVGILELDFRIAGECEIAFFGLVPELTGQGHGKWLMAYAQQLAWSNRDEMSGDTGPIRRLWLHSCTLDAPSALSFYQKSGFTPFSRATETFPDPRLTGIYPRIAAPHIPLID